MIITSTRQEVPELSDGAAMCCTVEIVLVWWEETVAGDADPLGLLNLTWSPGFCKEIWAMICIVRSYDHQRCQEWIPLPVFILGQKNNSDSIHLFKICKRLLKHVLKKQQQQSALHCYSGMNHILM